MNSMKRPPRHPPSKSYSNKNRQQGTPVRRSSIVSPGSKFLPRFLPEDDDVPYSSEQALEEAEAVMSSEGYSSGHLSSFNLLEVVINPRGTASFPPPRTPINTLSTSSHGSYATSSSDSANKNNTKKIIHANKSSNITADLEESISGTLNSMTNVLDNFSREYFGSSPMDPNSNQAMEEYVGWFYDSETHLTGSALEEMLGIDSLPDHLANVDLQGLEDWLNHCCGLAFRFVARGEEDVGVVMENFEEDDDFEPNKVPPPLPPNENNDEPSGQTGSPSTPSPQTENVDSESDEENTLYQGIPPIFFSPYFDLTDPQTFESLLLPNDTNLNTSTSSSSPVNTESMVEKQDTLTTYLDNIEISLLHQVRIKSHQFFRETDNFNFLKKLISESVQEVKELRETLAKIKQRAAVDVEQIPKMANQRDAFVEISSLLDKVNNVIQAKASVSGLMAAEDFLGVVEAFDSARSLLDEDNLSNISALAQVKDQLQSYENIVVENMSTALVEQFLSWSSFRDDEREEKKVMNTHTTVSTNHNNHKLAQVKVILQALEKLKKMHVAQDLYEIRLAEMVKVTVKTTITECAMDAMSPTNSNGTNGTNNNNASNTVSSPNPSSEKPTSLSIGVTSMTFPYFLNCLDMLFEQLLSVVRGAVRVDTFLKEEGIPLQQKEIQQKNSQSEENVANASSALSGATELAHKSVSELLRMRKEAHSLVSFDEMKSLWDACLSFTIQLEKCSHGNKAYGLRSTLLAQAKSFLERKHESCMAGLAAALDHEKWVQCDVSSERQAALTRLCSGRAAFTNNQPKSSKAKPPLQSNAQPSQHLNNAYIDETPYKMVWSCLLLLEYLLIDVSSAAHFQTLAASCVSKISELLRLFNSRTSQLVLGAGAIHSAARLKSINAKHLALVTQCLGLVLSILPHIRAALMAQLPSKQHTLLHDLDKIKTEYNEHLEKVLSKFVSIISGIVEHGLAPRISKTNFDTRAKMKGPLECCSFLDGVATNTRKMHQVLATLLPPDHLKDVFSRIFSNIDSTVPTLFLNADTASKGEKVSTPPKALQRGKTNPGAQDGEFCFPSTEAGKHRMIAEVELMTNGLNSLPGVNTWEFSAISVLKIKLELEMQTEKKESVTTIENDDHLQKNNSSSDIPPVEGTIDITITGNGKSSIGESKETKSAPKKEIKNEVEETP